MNKNELVYVMNVDWNWIKQRPHFIAELLNTQFNVHVMYQHRYGNEIEEKINLVRNGYNGAILDQAKTVSEKKHKLYTFAYFGTISTWFNFDYIQTDFCGFTY